MATSDSISSRSRSSNSGGSSCGDPVGNSSFDKDTEELDMVNSYKQRAAKNDYTSLTVNRIKLK